MHQTKAVTSKKHQQPAKRAKKNKSQPPLLNSSPAEIPTNHCSASVVSTDEDDNKDLICHSQSEDVQVLNHYVEVVLKIFSFFNTIFLLN